MRSPSPGTHPPSPPPPAPPAVDFAFSRKLVCQVRISDFAAVVVPLSVWAEGRAAISVAIRGRGQKETNREGHFGEEVLKFGQTSGREEKNLPVPLAALGVCGGEFRWFREVAIVLLQLLNVFKYSHKMTNAILRTVFFGANLFWGVFQHLQTTTPTPPATRMPAKIRPPIRSRS